MGMRRDVVIRLFPLSVTVAGVWMLRRPPWLGICRGKVGTQLAFGGGGAIAFFFSAAVLQRWITGDREPFPLAATWRDAVYQSVYFVVNATVEEAFFRGLLQGSVDARLGGWSWPQVAATTLAAVPLSLAYRLLPGRPSLLGVSLAHIGATAGFLGPGAWVLRRLGLALSGGPRVDRRRRFSTSRPYRARCRAGM